MDENNNGFFATHIEGQTYLTVPDPDFADMAMSLSTAYKPDYESGIVSPEDLGMLFTPEESKAIASVWAITSNITEAAMQMQSAAQTDLRSILRQAITAEVDRDIIVAAAEKYANTPWWTYTEVTHLEKDGQHDMLDVICSNEKLNRSFPLEARPDIYNLPPNEQRRVLRLPKRYLFVEFMSRYGLSIACAHFNIPFGVIKTPDHLLIKSTPIADTLRGINKLTVKAAESTAELTRSETVSYTLKNEKGYEVTLTGELKYKQYGIAVASPEADKLVKMTNGAMLQNKAAPSYTFSLKEICNAWGLKDANTTWKKINDAAEALQGVKITIKGKNGREEKNRFGSLVDFIDTNADGKGHPRSITVHPGTVWRNEVTAREGSIEQLPERVFLLSGGAYWIAVAFSRRASTATQYPDRLKVGTLLKECDFKTPDEIKDKGHIKQLIAMPFKRELDKAVEEGIFESYSVYEGGVELTPEEFTSSRVMNDYKRFTSLTIAIVWAADMKPDYSKRNEARAARIGEGKAKTKRNKTNKAKG